MLRDNARGRPGEGRPRMSIDGDALILDRTTDDLAPIEAMSRTLRHPRAVCPGFVVHVMRKDRTGWRRQVFVSLAGANKAIDRAHANGVECRVQLVELVPVPHAPLIIVGGEDQ